MSIAQGSEIFGLRQTAMFDNLIQDLTFILILSRFHVHMYNCYASRIAKSNQDIFG